MFCCCTLECQKPVSVVAMLAAFFAELAYLATVMLNELFYYHYLAIGLVSCWTQPSAVDRNPGSAVGFDVPLDLESQHVATQTSLLDVISPRLTRHTD